MFLSLSNVDRTEVISVHCVPGQGCPGMERQCHLLVTKDGKLVANKIRVWQPTTLPSGMEIHVCCKFLSEPSGSVKPIDNCIGSDIGVTVTATTCQPMRGGRKLYEWRAILVLY